MDCIKEASLMLDRFLRKELSGVDISEDVYNSMNYYAYKNYYYYEMDAEYAMRDAVSRALRENHIEISGFDYWIA